MNIIGMLAYLGVGCLLHLMLIGQRFDWSGAATWGVILGWPFIVAMLCYVLGFAYYSALRALRWRRFRAKKVQGPNENWPHPIHRHRDEP